MEILKIRGNSTTNKWYVVIFYGKDKVSSVKYGSKQLSRKRGADSE